ncbi:putative integral membrane protein [Streptomyces himastatinicus ATCC 53653]|uniref:Putative integral membrane protein n=1 Tax=Streptomyces himastatinicus ATCC 53653 TaxID=457427 RepID=D9W7C1_9ACTN|nr:MMPL family transporter [Streptomyces himastatinicus]EFL26732.1 putative integral membrane protein [Streptomyces himastatinicus ATCC 53653]
MSTTRRGLAVRLGGWSTRHRKSAIIGWLLFVVVVAVVGGMSGSRQMTNSENGAGDSARAQKVLEDAGLSTPAGEMVMLRSTDPDGWRAAARDLSARLEKTGETARIQPPVRSASGREGLVAFQLKGDPDTAGERVKPVLDAVAATESAHRGITAHEFGDATAQHELDGMLKNDFKKAEFTAVPLALGILLVVFGALVAALLPVLLGVTACIGTFGLLALVSHKLPLYDSTNSVMFLVGLAVGVDYCLFYLRRERDERAAGRDPETALRIAAETSGRAVLVSGITVMLAMSGMFLSGLMLFQGFAVATLLVVLMAMLGSVTVLPATLSWLGDRVDKGRVPLLNRRRDKGAHASGGISGTLMKPVLARPKLFAAVSAALLLVMCAPALGMKTENLGMEDQFGSDAPLTVAYKEITGAFPGGPAPAEVVVRADDISSSRFGAAVTDFKRQLADSGRFGKAVEVELHAEQGVARIEVPLAGNGENATSQRALDTLRDDLVPDVLGPVSDQAYVGGELAENRDFTDQLKTDIAPVFVFIAAVTFLLMLVCFRSLPIAIVSILLNLLSVGAAYGTMTAVFQHGWGAELLGMEPAGAIESWMPLFVLVILFGLSMDYHVFVVSRIREAHDRGLTTREAIREGIRTTAGSVTGAATIMVAVFSVLALLRMQDMQQMGVGLAVAVLVDATLVRMLLLPSAMALLGERTWYLPRALRWLPNVNHGEAPAPAESRPLVGADR